MLLICARTEARHTNAINEDAAQESERRLVDSYLRLGEISHLALQRDTITKHY